MAPTTASRIAKEGTTDESHAHSHRRGSCRPPGRGRPRRGRRRGVVRGRRARAHHDGHPRGAHRGRLTDRSPHRLVRQPGLQGRPQGRRRDQGRKRTGLRLRVRHPGPHRHQRPRRRQRGLADRHLLERQDLRRPRRRHRSLHRPRRDQGRRAGFDADPVALGDCGSLEVGPASSPSAARSACPKR